LEVVQKRSLERLQIKGNQNSHQILSPFIPPITIHFVLMVDKLLFCFDGFSFNSIFTFFGTTSIKGSQNFYETQKVAQLLSVIALFIPPITII